MKHIILVMLSLCLCVGFGADIHAQETPSVDQLMQDGSQAYQHGDFEQAVERWTASGGGLRAICRAPGADRRVDSSVRGLSVAWPLSDGGDSA